MEIKFINTEYEKELGEIIGLFFPTFETEENQNTITFEALTDKNVVTINEKKYEFPLELEKRKSDEKNALYLALSDYFKKTFEWGSITGVRPTKIGYDLLEKGVPKYLLKETLMKDYHLSEQKAKLIKDTISNQNCIIKNDNLVDIFINIPICPSRCKYCSFISSQYEQVKNKIPSYLNCLIKEIDAIKEIISTKNLIVRSIYIGGGTPTVLSAEELEEILGKLSYPSVEFTVEAGRPDTITREKLEVLKRNNVTRICVNPQTFCEKTLKQIGRNHTVKDVISAYMLAIEFGFDVNIDLIAGLPGEKFTNFKKSIETAIEMAPANLTIHTLALKRGSNLTNEAIKNNEIQSFNCPPAEEVKKMIDYSNRRLLEEKYNPYYLYKQKNTPLGLENVGYAQKGHVCIFNVDSMEETCSVLACGAHAISKRVFSLENRIERCCNVKFIEDYISRIDEMIERKKELFK
ncbi:MAG: coproporphyrinogen dehydrogenase HemZ [Christensenellales bacterium]